MKPAITAESWKMMLAFGPRVLVGPSQVPELVTNLPDVPRHALAALALYGQQFGFTHEDVQLLTWSDRHTVEGSEADRIITEKRRNLAERISALLPPEG